MGVDCSKMGAALTACFPPMTLDLPDKPWMSWENHPKARLYVVGKKLGAGAFSEVYLAKKKPLIVNGEEVALKVIFLGNPRLSETSVALLKQESDILEKLNHRNIVDVKATHMWEKNKVLIIEEELLGGEELLDAAQEAITQHGFTITESFAARVLKQVLEGVKYMQQKGVIHRDLKTENLRLTCPAKKWVDNPDLMHLKIIDFGLSCRMSDNPETGWLGSPGYVAPEVIENKPHTPAMDLFACGVILFMLLTGMKPCDNDVCMALSYSKLEADEYPNMIKNRRWDSVSTQGQDLVYGLMERDPLKRLSAEQALQHPFLRKASTIESSKPMLGNSDDLLPADIKETDQLQADIAFKDTAEQERWRDLADTITQVRQAMKAKPRLARSSTSPQQTQWRNALARAYLRTKRGAADFTAGRLGYLATPMPTRMALTRHRSHSTGAMNAVKAAEAAAGAAKLASAASEPQPRAQTPPARMGTGPTAASAGIGAACWATPKPPAPLAPGVGQGKDLLSDEDALAIYQGLRKRVNKRMQAKEELMALVEQTVIEKKEELEAMYALEDHMVLELSREAGPSISAATPK